MKIKKIIIIILLIPILLIQKHQIKETEKFDIVKHTTYQNQKNNIQLVSMNIIEVAPTPIPTPKPIPTITATNEEINMLAKVLWAEARGVPSKMEQAAVVWCILNRVDTGRGSIVSVITAKKQFAYKKSNPVEKEFLDLAKDVLLRWEYEKNGETDVGRVLPSDYLWFGGDGTHNYFRNQYEFKEENRREVIWDWNLPNPYEN